MAKVMFEINTKGICLLCLDESSELLRNVESRRIAFRMLLRYLKINVLKLCNFSSTFLQTLDTVEENNSTDVGVAMCGTCYEVIINFSNFYEEFERIRLQLDKCLQSLYGFMVNGEKKQDRVREYHRRIRTLNGADLFTLNLGEILKKQILEKCFLKVEAAVPKISLVKQICPNSDLFATTDSHSQLLPALTSQHQPTTVEIKKTVVSGKVKLPTAKRSKAFTTQLQSRTNSTVVSTLRTVEDSTTFSGNLCNNNSVTNDSRSRTDMDYEIDEEYYDDDDDYPLVKVETEMEKPESNSSIEYEFNSFAKSDLEISQHVYPKTSLELDVSSSSVNYNFTNIHTNYGSDIGMYSLAINQLNPTTSRKINANQQYIKKKKRVRKFAPCDICGKSVRKDYLPRHKLTHSGDAPYQCQYCNSKFRDAPLKLLHVKSLHTMIFYSKDLPRGTTLAEVDGVIESMLDTNSEPKGTNECPYCPKKLIEGQRSSSRTHILHKHFDKVLMLLRNQVAHLQDNVEEHQIFMGSIPYVGMLTDGTQNQQHFSDPLS